jgi:glycosyltransferase involved in cell wall biosynthesis
VDTTKTLQHYLETTSNDYSALEETYRTQTGSELVQDPYASVRKPIANLNLSASVIIPAFNSRSTLEQCLRAIELNSFNRKYPGQLEVIIVDDGSRDGTWELLEQLQLKVNLKAIQQDHYGAAHARNTALKYAESDVIICCDSDIIMTPFCIEELMKRHQTLDNVLLMGFRSNSDVHDPRLQPHTLAQHLPDLLPPFAEDFRIAHPLISITRSLNHFKDWGNGKQLFLPVVPLMDLPQSVWGALFSLRRSSFLNMGGFNENFQGWGFEDTLIGAQAIGQGNYIIPVYSASGLHLEHSDRLPNKVNSHTFNYHVMQKVLQAPLRDHPLDWLEKRQSRVLNHFERAYSHSESNKDDQIFLAAFDTMLADPYRCGEYFYELGQYSKAIEFFSQCDSLDSRVTFAMANALRAEGKLEHAI